MTAGSFAPSQQLFETKLAASFHTSRGPVREALHQLSAEGLLRRERNRGVFVISLDLAVVSDLYLARGVVEEAAALIVARFKRPRLAGLEDAMARMRQATKRGNWAQIVDADLAFHEALVEASRSRHLIRMFRSLSAETRMSLAWVEPLYPDPTDVDNEHQPILDAVASRNAARVRREIGLHMRETVRRLEEQASEGPDPPALSVRRDWKGGVAPMSKATGSLSTPIKADSQDDPDDGIAGIGR